MENNRDKTGRYLPGHAIAGPGNPQLKRLASYRRAIHAAVSESDIQEIFEDLVNKSKSGDLEAIKVLLPYCLGKPKIMDESVQFDLGTFKSAGDLVTVTNAILSNLSKGEMSPEEAVKISSVVEISRRAIETSILETRIGELEKVSRLQ